MREKQQTTHLTKWCFSKVSKLRMKDNVGLIILSKEELFSCYCDYIYKIVLSNYLVTSMCLMRSKTRVE
jgi:hypothetical protein